MRRLLPIVLLVFLNLVVLACKETGEANILVQSISIEGDNITDGGSSQLVAKIVPENASNPSVIWTVSDEEIATISSDENLTAVSNGTVRVTVTAQDESGVSQTRILGVDGVVVPAVLVEEIIVSGAAIEDGGYRQMEAHVLPENANDKGVIWSVSDESIAVITKEGLLKPKQNGVVIVAATATDGTAIIGELEVSISGLDDSVNGIVVTTKEELMSALASIQSGEKIYVREGTYPFTSTIKLTRSGTVNSLISLLAYPGERPVLDFSSMTENSSNRGMELTGDYWHIKGIDFYRAGDNGLFVGGSHNMIEFCSFYENFDTGLQIGYGGSENTILNCDSYYNADSSVENADGFACKMDAGSGNQFIGCRAWQNLDDGWDGYLRGTDNITTTYENCWAFLNGRLKDGTVGGGDGNGFKSGGSDDKQLKHHAVFKNCLAAGNVVDGFDHNSNRGDVTLYHCAAYNNGRNINFGSTNIANSLTIKNTWSLPQDNDSYQATTTDVFNNGWQNDLETTAEDFISLDIELLKSPRNADGSLPDIDFMKLQSGSDLIDAGVDVGIDYHGSAPDIGPFESNE